MKKPENVPKTLFNFSENDLIHHITNGNRMVVYFSKEKITEDSRELLINFQQQVNQKVDDINIGLYTCNSTMFDCSNDAIKFPRIRLFEKKRSQNFTLGDGNLGDILGEIDKFINTKIYTINSEKQMSVFLNNNEYAIIANIDRQNKNHTKLLKEIALKGRQMTPFFYNISMIKNKEILSNYSQFSEEGIYFYSSHDNQPITSKYPFTIKMEESTLDTVTEFFESEVLPPVIYFTNNDFGRVFTGVINTQFIYFTNNLESISTKTAFEEMKKAALFNREDDLYSQRIVFVIYPIGINKGVEVSFGEIKDGDAYITQVTQSSFLRFKFNKEQLSSSNISGFIEDYRNKKVNPFHVSEEDHPEDLFLDDSQILIVTGNQFRQKIIQNRENFLVLFCYNYENCKYTINSVKLLDKLNSNRTALRFAYVEGQKNEVPGVLIDEYPIFLLYKSPYKGRPKYYELDSNLAQLSGWINTYVPGMNYSLTGDEVFEHHYNSSEEKAQKTIRESIVSMNYTMEGITPELLKKIVDGFHEPEEDL